MQFFLLPTKRIISVSLISWRSIVPFFDCLIRQPMTNAISDHYFFISLCNEKTKWILDQMRGKAVTRLRKSGSLRVNVYFKHGFKFQFCSSCPVSRWLVILHFVSKKTVCFGGFEYEIYSALLCHLQWFRVFAIPKSIESMAIMKNRKYPPEIGSVAWH